MHEKSLQPTMQQMLTGIEGRILLDLTTRVLGQPDDILSHAREYLEQGLVPEEVVLTVETYREHEQHKAIKLRQEELAINIATVVMAHVWQDENNKARTHHRRIPH